MSEKYTIDSLFDATVFDLDGEKIGKVHQVFTDDQSEEPTWVSVNMGLFGAKETLIPISDARISGNDIHAPFDKSFVKDAPNVDAADHLDAEDERRLYEYYGKQDPRAQARLRRHTAAQADTGNGGAADEHQN